MNVTTDDDRRRTDALAGVLAGELDGNSRAILPFPVLASCGTLVAALVAVSVVISIIGYRDDLVVVWYRFPFLFKVLSMAIAVVGSVLWLRRCGTAGAHARLLACIAPALAVIGTGAILDPFEFPATGLQTFSVITCVASIVFAAMPSLAVLMLVLRRGVPTDLVRAGGSAGLLAGSLGALAYALACVNDGFTFVALWYTTAIAITALIGAALGPRALRW